MIYIFNKFPNDARAARSGDHTMRTTAIGQQDSKVTQLWNCFGVNVWSCRKSLKCEIFISDSINVILSFIILDPSGTFRVRNFVTKLRDSE